MNAHAKPVTQLPAMLQTALDAGGMDAALGLARALGGQLVYIPKKLPSDHHPLVKAAGRKAGDAIVSAFGGEHCEIPTIRSLRRPLALAMLAAGKGANETAKETGLSHRDVRRMREYIRLGVAPGAMPAARRIKPRKIDPRQIDIEMFIKPPHPSR